MKEGNVVLVFVLSIVGLQVCTRARFVNVVWILAGASMAVSGQVHFVMTGFVFLLDSQFGECGKTSRKIGWMKSHLKLDALTYSMFLIVLMDDAATTWKAEILTECCCPMDVHHPQRSPGFQNERKRAIARQRASMADGGQAYFVMTGFAFKLVSKLGERREKRHGRLNAKIAFETRRVDAQHVLDRADGWCRGDAEGLRTSRMLLHDGRALSPMGVWPSQ